MLKDRLRAARQKLGLTLDNVAKKVGVSRQTIHRYETGVITNIPQVNIEKIAAVLETTPAKLMGWDIDENLSHISNLVPITGKPVPIIGTIAAGKPILAEENIEGEATPAADIRADFALRVKGDSMEGVPILDGDIVFIRSQPEVENGEIAAVLIDNEATLKRFYNNGNSVMLVSENPKYPPFIYTKENCDDFRILGKAIAYQHSLE
ncbi:MAG: helix-turn-helix domain-containing protein [Selenomonadaceae bacterium]|nr:helix-turn-helix domain-containing protein [Selenomonadaceae bacterium]